MVIVLRQLSAHVDPCVEALYTARRLLPRIGPISAFIQLASPTGLALSRHVVAFEANPAMVERIKDNVALNHFQNADIVSAAVHSEPEASTSISQAVRASLLSTRLAAR